MAVLPDLVDWFIDPSWKLDQMSMSFVVLGLLYLLKNVRSVHPVNRARRVISTPLQCCKVACDTDQTASKFLRALAVNAPIKTLVESIDKCLVFWNKDEHLVKLFDLVHA